MPRVFPFRALHFDVAKIGSLDKVVSQPYDKINEATQQKYYERDPKHIVRIAKTKDEPGKDKYAEAGKTLEAWLADGTIVREKEPAIWISHQVFKFNGETRTRKGFVAIGELAEFGKGGVHAHEKTLLAPKKDRFALMTATKGLTEGHIFMLYSDPKNAANSALDPFTKGPPTLEAKDDYGEIHRAWRVTDPKAIAAVQADLAARDIFIADGHHRYEVALQYREECKKQGLKCEGNETYDRRMMTFINMEDPGMVIFPTHRLVSGLKTFEAKEFLSKIAPFFSAKDYGKYTEATRRELVEDLRIEGQVKHCFGFATPAGGLWLLTLIDDKMLDTEIRDQRAPEWKRLDVAILHSLILDRALGITPEMVEQEKHMSYARHADEVWAALPKVQAAFLLNPTKLAEVKVISEKGERMPQKSTDFYPKLLTGFIMNRVSFAR
ncbi:MAG: DUF1015 domain-containing protein [Planctomycetes bacterium]|nr:DUF1015 domain-containing protein [Planctomycetota bacterium]